MWQAIRQWWQRLIERGREPAIPNPYDKNLPEEMEKRRLPADGGAKIKTKHTNIKGPRTD